MIIKLQKWLGQYMSQKLAYYVVFCSYVIIVSIPIIILGYLFNCIIFMVVASILTNYLRKFSYGFHTTNGKCIILTYCLLIIFSYLSKTISLEWSFFIALLSVRYIYLYAPLELTVKNKSRQWHRDKIQLIVFIYLIISIITFYFGFDLISSCVLWSINMVALTLFKNIDEIKI